MKTQQNQLSPPPDNDRHTSTAAAVSGDGLSSGPREPNHLENRIANEIARLDDEQTEALIYLLRELREQGLPLNEATARGCVGGAKQVINYLLIEAKEQETLQELRRHRDGLPEPERIIFVCDAMKKHCFYKGSLQRNVIKRLLGQVSPNTHKPYDKETVEHVTRRFRELLEGTTPEFQRKTLEYYRENVLPDTEAYYADEDETQAVYDELLDVLHSKTNEEIRAITQRLQMLS